MRAAKCPRQAPVVALQRIVGPVDVVRMGLAHRGDVPRRDRVSLHPSTLEVEPEALPAPLVLDRRVYLRITLLDDVWVTLRQDIGLSEHLKELDLSRLHRNRGLIRRNMLLDHLPAQHLLPVEETAGDVCRWELIAH